jgi:peptide deformylase
MLDTMHAAEGIGLAAPQVGDTRRLIVVDVSYFDPSFEPLSLIDPEILETDGEETGREGCLSIPEIYEEVTRPGQIRVQGLDPEGHPVSASAEGIAARVIQHEIDHLNGVLFIDYLSVVRRQMLRGALRKIQKEGRKQRPELRALEAEELERAATKSSGEPAF